MGNAIVRWTGGARCVRLLKRLVALSLLLVAGPLSAAVSSDDVPLSGPLPPGYWRTLLHLGADFERHHLRSNRTEDINVDFLADYGGEHNQFPYPGLTVELPAAETADNRLVWTAMTNAAPDGLWRPHNQDNYIKYWHLYIIVPGADARPVRFHYRHDDCIRMWVNGRLTVSRDTWDVGNVYTQDGMLDAGLNSVTIKLREGTGADYMAMRVTDRANADFADLRYALAPDAYLIEALPATGVGESTVTLAAQFSVITGRQYTVYALWGESDHGTSLEAWQANGVATDLGQPPSGTLTHSAEGLAPDTRYGYRFAVIDGTRSRWTEPVAFKTLGGRPAGEVFLPVAVDGVRVRVTGVLTGGARAHCHLHVASADGEWSRRYDFGERLEGPFATNLTGLALDTAYTAHVSVSNAYGTAQSRSATFRTDAYSVETLHWIGADDRRWDNPANWDPDYNLYPRRHDTAVIRNRRSETLEIELDGNRSVRGLHAGHRDDAGGWTLGPTGTTVRVGTGGLVIRASRHDNRDVTIDSALALEGPGWLALDGSGNSRLHLVGGVSGPGGLVISARNGRGTVRIDRPWHGTGDLLLRHGPRAVRFEGDGALTGVRSLTAVLGAAPVLTGGADRLHPQTRVTLREGGGLLFEGDTAVEATLGTLRLGGGLARVGLDTATNTPAVLRVDRLAHDPASPAVLVVSSAGGRLGHDRRLHVAHVGQHAVTDGALLPFALGWSADHDGPVPDTFLRHDTERGLVPLTPGADDARPDASGAFPSRSDGGRRVVRLALPDEGVTELTLSDGRTDIDALFVDGPAGAGDGRLQLAGGDELVVRAGALALAAPGDGPAGRVELTVPRVRFGAPDTVTPGLVTVFGTAGAGAWQLDSELAGAGGLIVWQAQAGADTGLGGDNRALHGPIVIGGDAGRGVRVTHGQALGEGGNSLHIGQAARVVAAVPSDSPDIPRVRSLSGFGTVIGESGFVVGRTAGAVSGNRFRLGPDGRLAPGCEHVAGTLTLERFRAVELTDGTLHIRLSPFTEAVSRLAVNHVQDGVTLSGSRLVVETDSAMAVGDTFRVLAVGGAAPLWGRFANPGDRVETRHAGWRYVFDIRYIRAPGGGADSAIELVVSEITPLAVDTVLLVY